MLAKFFDLVQVFVTSSGTGATVNLSATALTGYQTPAAAGVSPDDVVSYMLRDGANWEVGRGYIASNQLTRTVVQASSAGGSRINLSGAAIMMLTASAAELNQVRYEPPPALGPVWPVLWNHDPTKSSIEDSIQAGIDAGYNDILIEKEDTFPCGQVDIPDFAYPSKPWEATPSFNIEGCGNNSTVLQQSDTAADYMFGQESWRDEAERGQRLGAHFGKMTLVGLSQAGVDAPLIALSNNSQAIFSDMTVGGNQAGASIELFAHQNGGLWTARFYNVHGPRHEYVIISAAVLTDPVTGAKFGNSFGNWDRIREIYSGYHVRINGGRTVVGKANDFLVSGCNVNNMINGCVSTEGHGAFAPGYPAGGGSDNLMVDMSSFFAAQATRKMEEGFVTYVSPDGLTIGLRTDYFVTGADRSNYFKDCGFIIRGTDGAWRGEWIDDQTVGTRRITLAAALPVIPVVGDRYRICAGSPEARAKGFKANTMQHGVYWEQSEYGARVLCRFEEIRSLTAHPTANGKVDFGGSYRVVDDADPCICMDGTDWIADGVGGALNPHGGGYRGAMNANLAGKIIRLSANGVMFSERINASGQTVEDGDVVREPASGDVLNVAAAVNATSTAGKHYIVVTNGPGVPNGRRVGIALPGTIAKAKFINNTGSSITVNAGDWAIGKSGVAVSNNIGGCTTLDDATITSAQKRDAIGIVTRNVTCPANAVTKINVRVTP